MTINKEQENQKVTLYVDGRLDTTTAPKFQDALMPAFEEAEEIIVDLTKLAYMSSAGLRVLLMGQKTANAKGVSLKISGVSEEIMEIFVITGFAETLTIM